MTILQNFAMAAASVLAAVCIAVIIYGEFGRGGFPFAFLGGLAAGYSAMRFFLNLPLE